MAIAAAGVLLGGRYLLDRPIAEGGMGAVWRARHLKLDIPVAVKLMSPLLASSAAARARFEREAKAAARLASPHVVEVHDYGVEGEAPYIVMEHLEGEDLAARLDARGRLELEETVELVEQIAKALEVAHAAGVVHRDLKPGNVFLARTGRDEIVKVLDFGVAKLRAEPGTLPGTLMGSPRYMSPEQARGEGALDHRSDLWSLGVVAYECLTGRLPFEHDDITELILSILSADAPAASSAAPWLGPPHDRFFERALARLPADRFQSARDLAGALREIAGSPPRSRASVRPPPRAAADTKAPADAARTRENERTVEIAGRARPDGSRPGRSASPAGEPRDEAARDDAGARTTPGEVVAGRFELLGVAGEGSMGTVHRARDRVEGGVVALKLFHAASLDAERFFREANALVEVRHPAVVRYVAHGLTAEGAPYLAMEWIEGAPLADRLREGPFGVEEALALAARVAEALGAAHRAGVVHGDLSPANVLLPGGDAAQAKVIDFGVARDRRAHRATGLPAGATRVERPAAPGARRGIVTGTPGYMAPEQALGDPDIDARADVFALGCVLYTSLTGRSPFPADTALAAAARFAGGPAPRARELAASVPAVVDELLSRLLAREREARPADGAAAAALLAGLPPASRSPRAREGITTTERRLLPAILVVPSGAVERLSSDGVHLASDAASEDATWDVSAELVALADRLGPIARRFQARVEIVQGGAVAVLIDAAGLLADQAAHAALCALALRAAVPDIAIAIATGRRGDAGDVLQRAAGCLVRARGLAQAGGSGSEGERSPLSISGPPSLDPRASTGAGAGRPLRGIAIDDATLGLLEGRFEIERGASVHALHGRPRAGDDAEGRLLGKVTPCVGREPELGLLDALLRECAEEPSAKAVIVKGPAGSGKSRLRRELLRRLAQRGDSLCAWIGRGDVMNAGSPFAILANALHAMLGLSGGEPDDERRERLRARVAERVPAPRQEQVALFLGEMIGIPFPEGVGPEIEAAREDPLLLGDQRRRAFEDLVEAETAEGVVMLVLEDLHLGDLPTVKLVDAALRALAERPFFVLATARPSIDDLFPKLWEGRVAQEIRVGPLTAKASERLVRSVLGAKAAADTVARIVARAAGHPLHIEEVLRAVAEGSEGELPDTVLAVVEARLAALDPSARLVLRAASVLGRTFWDGAAAALTSMSVDEVRALLRELAQHEWITRAPRSRFPGETEHVIAQDLVQEAAYAMLPGADRALGHRLAAAWLERAGERDPVVLARHLELGGEPARAAAWLLRAAEQALDGNDFASAVVHADRAADLAPSPAHRARARAVAADAHLHGGDLEPARRCGFEAMEQLAPSDPGYFHACAAAAVASGKLGDIARVADVARALLALDPAAASPTAFSTAAGPTVVQLVIGGERPLAEALQARFQAIVRAGAAPEPLAIAQLERGAGIFDAFSGDLFGSITHQRAAVAAFEAAGDRRNACAMGKTLGWYLGELGALEEAERALRAAIDTAERMGLGSLAPHARHDLGSPLLRLGKLDEARASQEELLPIFEAQGERRLLSSAHALLSGIAVAAGRLDDAERSARAAIETSASPPIRFTALARLTDALRAAGRHEEALAASGEALAIAGEGGSVEECFVLCLLARAESLLALGRDAEAAATLDRARADLDARAGAIRDPGLRASFLARIPENARVLSLAGARGGPPPA